MFAQFRSRERRSILVVSGLALILALFACCARAQGHAAPMVSDVWSRATASQAQAGAVFLTIKGGETDDSLISGSVASTIAERVELHTHSHDADTGVMRMRPVSMIDVPAGETVTLRPGGLHIMLMGLAEPLSEGADIPLTLTFEHAGEVTAVATVMAAGSSGPASDDDKADGHAH